MMRIDSSWSWVPQAPNIIAPRQRGLTFIPVRPSVRYSIGPTLATDLAEGAAARLQPPRRAHESAAAHRSMGSPLLSKLRNAASVSLMACSSPEDSARSTRVSAEGTSCSATGLWRSMS